MSELYNGLPPRTKPWTRTELEQAAKYRETDTFLWYNLNPRGMLTDDCAIRAIAAGTGLSWTTVFDALCNTARKQGMLPNSDRVLFSYLRSMGWTKHNRPGKYVDVGSFARRLSLNYGDGRLGPVICAANHSRHMVCIIPTSSRPGESCQYKAVDTWDSTYYDVGQFWTRTNDIDCSLLSRPSES